MFRRLFRGKIDVPKGGNELYSFLERFRPEAAELYLTRERDDDADLAFGMTVALLDIALAGEFVRQHGANISKLHGPFDPNVLAFETVIFFHYAFRSFYEQTRYADYADNRYESKFEGFSISTGIVTALIGKHLRTQSDDVFAHRFNTYLKHPGIDGAVGATEHFRLILQTLAGASSPAISYGPASLDLLAGTEMTAITHSFSSAYLEAFSAIFDDLIARHSLES